MAFSCEIVFALLVLLAGIIRGPGEIFVIDKVVKIEGLVNEAARNDCYKKNVQITTATTHAAAECLLGYVKTELGDNLPFTFEGTAAHIQGSQNRAKEVFRRNVFKIFGYKLPNDQTNVNQIRYDAADPFDHVGPPIDPTGDLGLVRLNRLIGDAFSEKAMARVTSHLKTETGQTQAANSGTAPWIVPAVAPDLPLTALLARLINVNVNE